MLFNFPNKKGKTDSHSKPGKSNNGCSGMELLKNRSVIRLNSTSIYSNSQRDKKDDKTGLHRDFMDLECFDGC